MTIRMSPGNKTATHTNRHSKTNQKANHKYKCSQRNQTLPHSIWRQSHTDLSGLQAASPPLQADGMDSLLEEIKFPPQFTSTWPQESPLSRQQLIWRIPQSAGLRASHQSRTDGKGGICPMSFLFPSLQMVFITGFKIRIGTQF